MIDTTDERFKKIPPLVLKKARNLPGPQRREYLQDLIGRYEYRLNHLNRVMRDMIIQAEASATEWREQQKLHFEEVVNQLYVLRDL